MGTMRVEEASLTAVADAIREKGGTSEGLSFPEGFVNAVAGIQAGGGGDVLFATGTIDVAKGETMAGYAPVYLKDANVPPKNCFFAVFACREKSSTTRSTTKIEAILCNMHRDETLKKLAYEWYAYGQPEGQQYMYIPFAYVDTWEPFWMFTDRGLHFNFVGVGGTKQFEAESVTYRWVVCGDGIELR